MASIITSLTIVYSTVYSGVDQRKPQSSGSLAFVWGIHRDRWIPRTKGQLRGKCFHLMTSPWNDSIMSPFAHVIAAQRLRTLAESICVHLFLIQSDHNEISGSVITSWWRHQTETFPRTNGWVNHGETWFETPSCPIWRHCNDSLQSVGWNHLTIFKLQQCSRWSLALNWACDDWVW